MKRIHSSPFGSNKRDEDEDQDRGKKNPTMFFIKRFYISPPEKQPNYMPPLTVQRYNMTVGLKKVLNRLNPSSTRGFNIRAVDDNFFFHKNPIHLLKASNHIC